MKNILIVIHIIISISLMIVILIQAKGTGLGNVFGGGGETFRSKRGVEKILHYLTIFLCILFFLTSLLSIVIK